MARVDLDLTLPEGSQIPSQISVEQGSFFFRGDEAGLQGTADVFFSCRNS